MQVKVAPCWVEWNVNDAVVAVTEPDGPVSMIVSGVGLAAACGAVRPVISATTASSTTPRRARRRDPMRSVVIDSPVVEALRCTSAQRRRECIAATCAATSFI